MILTQPKKIWNTSIPLKTISIGWVSTGANMSIMPQTTMTSSMKSLSTSSERVRPM